MEILPRSKLCDFVGRYVLRAKLFCLKTFIIVTGLECSYGKIFILVTVMWAAKTEISVTGPAQPLYGNCIAGPCTAICITHVRATVEPDRNLRCKNRFSQIVGRFTFYVCVVSFKANEIIVNRENLLTEMTCERESNIPTKNGFLLWHGTRGDETQWTKTAPGGDGTYAGSFSE